MDLVSKIINAMMVEKYYRQAMRASGSGPASLYNDKSGTFKKNQRKQRKLNAKRKRR